MLILVISPCLYAAEENEEDVVYNFRDEYERDTPRGSLLGFIKACEDGDFERARLYLDLRSVPKLKRKEQGSILAQKLKFIIDRAIEVDEMSLANTPKGVAKDGLSNTRDLAWVIEKDSQKYSFYLDRMWGPKVLVWKFSKSTVKNIPELYELYSNLKIIEYLPAFLVEMQMFTVQLWQWIITIIFFPISGWLAKFFTKKILKLIPRLSRSLSDYPKKNQLIDLRKPIFLFVAVLLWVLLAFSLNLTLAAQKIVTAVLGTILVIALTWGLLRSIDIFTVIFQYRLEKRELYSAGSVIPLGRRLAKILLFIITTLALLRVYNVDITALLAGLGVGGIAVALAAQKSLENLFSGIALITDQPVRVGDICRFNSQLGKVEDIGLRSTRIRTLERTLITIPNREFSQMTLENLSKRDKMKFESKLGIRYETTVDQLRYYIKELRRMLVSHPQVLQDEAIRVRFDGFGEYSLNIEIFCHLNTFRWYEYLAIREDLLLRMMDITEEAGTSFAFPSRTVYQDKAPSLDPSIQKVKEEEIESLRQDGNLPFPDFASSQYEEMRSTLHYPPKGSVSLPKPSKK